MHDLLLAVAFVGMIFSPLAFNRFHSERNEKIEPSGGAHTLSR